VRPPLSVMTIRNPLMDTAYDSPGTRNNHIHGAFGGTFGTNVRGPGRIHQGWDLYTSGAIEVYAITSGHIAAVDKNPVNSTRLTRYFTLAFTHADPLDGVQRSFYALYAHLGCIYGGQGTVEEGEVLGLTGTSGNAKGGPPHLHFAVMRRPYPTHGMTDYVDPGHFLGFHHVNADLILPWNRA